MDLTGQLSNLSALVEKLFATPLAMSIRTGSPERRAVPVFRQRRYERIRDAVLIELADGSRELRLIELRERVERRLGEPVDRVRFKDFVNDQTRSANPLLERCGYGVYRLRAEVEPSQRSTCD